MVELKQTMETISLSCIRPNAVPFIGFLFRSLTEHLQERQLTKSQGTTIPYYSLPHSTIRVQFWPRPHQQWCKLLSQCFWPSKRQNYLPAIMYQRMWCLKMLTSWSIHYCPLSCNYLLSSPILSNRSANYPRTWVILPFSFGASPTPYFTPVFCVTTYVLPDLVIKVTLILPLLFPLSSWVFTASSNYSFVFLFSNVYETR